MIRFAAVHALYVQQEDAAKAALGQQERRRGELILQRDVIVERQLAAARNVPTELHEQYLAYHRAQHELLVRQEAAITAQDTVIGEARTALAQAHQRRATIAKLRERDKAADLRRDERREQRRNDDRAAITIFSARGAL